MKQAEFEQVIDFAKAGDETSWSVLFRRFAPRILGYLRARGAPDPEDVLGRVFLNVARHLATFDGDERGFNAWIHKIAYHQLLDDHRARSRRPQDLSDDIELPALWDDPADTTVEALSLVDLLGVLSAPQRDVLSLRYVSDLTIEQIATITGRSHGSVKALQRRGLARLRKEIERRAYPYEGAAAFIEST